jgi:phosphoribosylformimino-5-aminoimidazole carboxamide ribotide isomerase
LIGIWRVFAALRAGRFDEQDLEYQLDNRGVLARILRPVMRRIARPSQMFGVGVLFGLGFDTATEVTLLALAGTGAAAGVPCQLGGGIRSVDTARAYVAAGVQRLVVGSVAIEDPGLLAELAHAFPGQMVLGLDARDGKVAVRGWLETSPLGAVDVAKRHEHLPLAGIVYTDIAKDGMMAGPNLPALAERVRAVRLPVIASGGVSNAEDIRQVAAVAAAGCIVGRALYEGSLTLASAAAAAGE